MFATFFLGLVAFYLIYFLGMVGYDLYLVGKEDESTNKAVEIDIAGAASSYVAKDVRSMFGSSQDTKKDNSGDEGSSGGGMAEYINNEYQDGYDADTLSDLFEKESQTPSLFSGIQMCM